MQRVLLLLSAICANAALGSNALLYRFFCLSRRTEAMEPRKAGRLVESNREREGKGEEEREEEQ